MGGGEFRATQKIEYRGVGVGCAVVNAFLEKVVCWDKIVEDTEVLKATGPTPEVAREELEKLVKGFCKRGILGNCSAKRIGPVKVEKYTTFLEALAEAFKGKGYVREYGPKW